MGTEGKEHDILNSTGTVVQLQCQADLRAALSDHHSNQNNEMYLLDVLSLSGHRQACRPTGLLNASIRHYYVNQTLLCVSTLQIF